MRAAGPTRTLRAGALALLLASLALFAAQCVRDPRVPFLSLTADAAWIAYPAPADGMMGLAPRDALPVTRFERGFELAQETDARLEVRALRGFDVWLDGEPLSVPAADHWREWREIPVPAPLAAGRHALRVDVTNPTGPALLALRMRVGDTTLRSDTQWRATPTRGAARSAVAVDTSRRNPSAFAMPSLAEGLRARAGTLLGAFALAAAGFLALRGRGLGSLAVRALPVLLIAVWLGPLARNALSLPTQVGFDARHHVAYVDFLREQQRLPHATDGWSMFHPPVYYLATALALEVGERAGAASLLGWKLVGLLAGLASALCVGLLARRLFARDGPEAGFAALLAGILPMNVYISSYVTNESLHAALATALVTATVAALLAPSTSRAALAGWVALAAAAALTKYTAWIAVSVAGLFLWLAWVRVERAPRRVTGARVAAAAAGIALLAGWWSVRAFAETGQLFPLNVDLPGESQVWWSQPGYATPVFFLGFGEVLTHPFLAGTHTAWDAFYSTLWGDGQLAGEMLAAARHAEWDWELMAAGYALALPATLLIALGALRAVGLALRADDPRLRAAYAFLLSFAWVLLLAVLYMTLRQPDYGLAKAFYGLAGIAPLSVCFGLGAGACDRWLAKRTPPALRALFFGWLGAFCAATFGPYLF